MTRLGVKKASIVVITVPDLESFAGFVIFHERRHRGAACKRHSDVKPITHPLNHAVPVRLAIDYLLAINDLGCAG